jgi:hypothetical protein
MKQIHILVTVLTGDPDTYGDILLVTTNKNRALYLRDMIARREPIPGLNYELLANFDDAQVITMPMGQLTQNVAMDDIGFHSWFAKAGKSSKLKQAYNKYVLKTDPKPYQSFGFWALTYYMDQYPKQKMLKISNTTTLC